MMIYHDPDRYETFSTSHTCEFHKHHPRGFYVGCTCGVTIGTRQVSEEEYRRRRAEREQREDDVILARAEGIRAKRSRAASGTEAQRATTVEQGVVHDGQVPKADAHD